MTTVPFRTPNRCGTCGAEWYDTHTCPNAPRSTSAPQVGGSATGVNGLIANNAGRPPLVLMVDREPFLRLLHCIDAMEKTRPDGSQQDHDAWEDLWEARKALTWR